MSQLQLSESAASELLAAINEQEEGHFLRIGVTAGGCSGFQYSLTFEKEDQFSETKDERHTVNDVPFVIDKLSKEMLKETTIDYHSDINKRGFVFKNPIEKRSCGCGQSFSV